MATTPNGRNKSSPSPTRNPAARAIESLLHLKSDASVSWLFLPLLCKILAQRSPIALLLSKLHSDGSCFSKHDELITDTATRHPTPNKIEKLLYNDIYKCASHAAGYAGSRGLVHWCQLA
jgi:hypothetical protein